VQYVREAPRFLSKIRTLSYLFPETGARREDPRRQESKLVINYKESMFDVENRSHC
jgi:hypothetical protein